MCARNAFKYIYSHILVVKVVASNSKEMAVGGRVTTKSENSFFL